MGKRWCTYQVSVEDSQGEEAFAAIWAREVSSDSDIEAFQAACRKKVLADCSTADFDSGNTLEAFHDGLSEMPTDAKRG